MHHTSPGSTSDHLASISRFLSRPLISTLFAFHPNDLGQALFSPPLEWGDWWDWPGEVCNGHQKPEQDEPWLVLLGFYESCLSGQKPSEQASLIPPVLRSLISDACKLSLPRDMGHVYPCHASPPKHPRHLRDSKTECLPGMSPKKAHEVAQLVGYLSTLTSPGSPMCSIQHVIDIGAGQAYLSRELRDQLRMHVLALDWNEVQSQGAARRDASKMTHKAARTPRLDADDPTGKQALRTKQSCAGGSLTYVTTKINPDSLVSSTTRWLADVAPASAGTHTPAQVTPVLFVALHACGSLTPDILRAFVSVRQQPEPVASTPATWSSQGAVVVGCCYNMMRSEDFPLSQTLRSCSLYPVHLSPGHLQLATQLPSQWTRSQQTLNEARLAMRKIVWRALLQDTFKRRQKFVAEGDAPGKSGEGNNTTGTGTRLERLGRLNNATYADWETFCDAVRRKLHLQHLPTMPPTRSERRIEVFHVLRCILGPVVESFILLDRLTWMSEELEGSPFTAQLVNLFDQANGSGRNVAIAILPNRDQQF